MKPIAAKTRSSLKLILITSLATLIVTGAGGYLLGIIGSPPSRESADSPPASEGERKIAYWKAPMNPTEIYDKPGKSAMGMDLVPVYEDELAGSGGDAAGAGGRKIAYWKAPMNPTEIYDKPGKSAMGMDLVPVYEDELIGGVEVRIDPVVQQNMGLRTTTAQNQPLVRSIRTYGHVTADETRTVRISSKTGGWVEKLYVDFTGKFVEKGEPLMELYSPELLAAQEEFLVALRSLNGTGRDSVNNLLMSSRRRLEYFDVAKSEIDAIQSSGKVKKALLIRSPASGYIIDRNIEEGGFIKAGTTLFRITDLSRVWVEAHIYEYELPWVKTHQRASMRLPYQPGRDYSGQVAYVYPYLQPKTRDVVIRLEFDNADLSLKPDMFADVLIETSTEGEGLVIPAEAVIHSGERNLVFVSRPGNKFTPRDVTLGPRLDNGQVQILTGIAPGEEVVTSGQFLIDSESKLKEAIQKMLEVKRAKTKPAADPDAEDFFEELQEEEEDFFEDMEPES